jgi:hypothetical protein
MLAPAYNFVAAPVCKVSTVISVLVQLSSSKTFVPLKSYFANPFPWATKTAGSPKALLLAEVP